MSGAAARGPATGEASSSAHVCGWCGRAFREDRAQPACRACPLTRLCGHVRCPHCGWENPARPGGRSRAPDADGASEPWWRRLARRLVPGTGGAP